jgi:hypothetical protein
MSEQRPPFLTDPAPVLLSGTTGSNDAAGGKTTTAHWWSDTLVAGGHYEYLIAFSPKGGNFAAEPVANAREAADAVAGGADRLEWTRPGMTGGGDLAEWHHAAVQFADGLAGSVVFVHDDAQMYPSGAGLAGAVSMGDNPGGDADVIKSIVTCQDPWDLPRKGVRANLNNLGWVGPMTDAGRRYFETFSLPDVADAIADRHTEPYVWSVYDGVDVWTFDPVPEDYAL